MGPNSVCNARMHSECVYIENACSQACVSTCLKANSLHFPKPDTENAFVYHN